LGGGVAVVLAAVIVWAVTRSKDRPEPVTPNNEVALVNERQPVTKPPTAKVDPTPIKPDRVDPKPDPAEIKPDKIEKKPDLKLEKTDPRPEKSDPKPGKVEREPERAGSPASPSEPELVPPPAVAAAADPSPPPKPKVEPPSVPVGEVLTFKDH